MRLPKKRLAQWPEGAGRVVDDMPKFLGLAVHVADDVDGALGQSQLGGKLGDLRQRRIEIGELPSQNAQDSQPRGERMQLHSLSDSKSRRHHFRTIDALAQERALGLPALPMGRKTNGCIETGRKRD